MKNAGSYTVSLDQKYFQNYIHKFIAAYLHPIPWVFNTIDFLIWKDH